MLLVTLFRCLFSTFSTIMAQQGMHAAMTAHVTTHMTGIRNSKPTATPEITNCGRRNPVELESIPYSVSGDGKDIRKKVIAHMVILCKK